MRRRAHHSERNQILLLSIAQIWCESYHANSENEDATKDCVATIHSVESEVIANKITAIFIVSSQTEIDLFAILKVNVEECPEIDKENCHVDVEERVEETIDAIDCWELIETVD